MRWVEYVLTISSAVNAFNRGIWSFKSIKCKNRLLIFRALNQMYMVKISPISNTTKNIRFNNLTAFATKKENSTVKKTHKIMTTIHKGQCFTNRIKYDISMVVINMAIVIENP